MINEAQVFLAGYVARDPRFRTTTNGTPCASLRVGFTPRRVDRETGEWTDGATSFVTVVCWRSLAENVAICLRKGEPVLVKGRLQVRPYEKDGTPRVAVEIEASSIGHDLARGVARFRRSSRSPGEAAASLNGPAGLDGLAGLNGLAGQDGIADPNGLAGEGGAIGQNRLAGEGGPAGQDRAADAGFGAAAPDDAAAALAQPAVAQPVGLSAPF